MSITIIDCIKLFKIKEKKLLFENIHFYSNIHYVIPLYLTRKRGIKNINSPHSIKPKLKYSHLDVYLIDQATNDTNLLFSCITVQVYTFKGHQSKHSLQIFQIALNHFSYTTNNKISIGYSFCEGDIRIINRETQPSRCNSKIALVKTNNRFISRFLKEVTRCYFFFNLRFQKNNIFIY